MKFPDKPGPLDRLFQRIGIACAVAGFALAITWTLRIGLADIYYQQYTLVSIEKAARLTPSRADYPEQIAWFLRDTEEQRAVQALERAVALNPYDANAWIQLGLIDEANDRLPEASRCLHHAASIDHTFLPAWSLANFYFRQNNPDQFWLWVHQASRIVPEDASPLFRLCWHYTEDGAMIERQLDLGRPDMQAQYINFLVSDNRATAVGSVALRLAAADRGQDTPLLLNACDWLLAQHQETAALGLWDRLADQQRIPFHAVHPGNRPTVTNANFVHSPSSIGFDWHLPTVPGVNASQENGAGGLKLEFSSDQPESVEVLSQVLAVQPNIAYNFTFDYSTSGIAPGSGLTWRVVNIATGSVLASTGSLSANNGAVGHLDFSAPADTRFVRLSLVYQRALGTTRIEGSLVLHKTALATT
ncbi:MAG: tetratricopeptide repeat protein [Acidobacteriaceae bacterium]